MEFSVLYSPRFERDFDRLIRTHQVSSALLDEIKSVLQIDPYNRSRAHQIKKLKDISYGDGQWCLRVWRFRVRYDMTDSAARLHSIKPRPEAYR